MKYDLIIFDCDGTLVDSEPVTNRLISTMMAERGISMTPEECLREFAGKNIMYITAFMEEHIGPFDHESFEEEYRSRCLTLFDDELEAVPGVIDILRQVRVKKCIASNGPRRKMEVTLKVTGIMKMFDPSNIYSAYDIGFWKPSPELYLHACAEMMVNPDRALVLEDTLPGVMGAVHGGIDVIVYNPDDDPVTKLDGIANYRSMQEIQSFLESVGILGSD